MYRAQNGVHKKTFAKKEVKWTSSPLNTIRMNWDAKCVPGLSIQHQCPTRLTPESSLTLLTEWEFPKKLFFYQQKMTSSIFLSIVLEWCLQKAYMGVLAKSPQKQQYLKSKTALTVCLLRSFSGSMEGVWIWVEPSSMMAQYWRPIKTLLLSSFNIG